MDKKTEKSSKFKTLIISTILMASAGCGSQSPSPVEAVTLPPPIVQITRTTPKLAEIPTPESLPSSAAPNPSDIHDLAEDLFGERLIQQILIPAIRVDSPVIPVGWKVNFSTTIQGGGYEWDSPGPDVGWVVTSALPDETGNILMYGHNNMYIEIFKNLGNLTHGDRIYLQTKGKRWQFEVSQIITLPILGASDEQVSNYQKYLQPTEQKRLTLISCWPPISNTHRVIVIAKPQE